jgi:hypothetical protein
MLEATCTFSPLPSLHKWEALLLLTSSKEITSRRKLFLSLSMYISTNMNEHKRELEFLFEIIRKHSLIFRLKNSYKQKTKYVF